MAKKIIIFYPYKIDSQKSGSQVRPKKIYNAFLKEGYDVFLLAGNAKERKEKFNLLKKENNIKKYSFCYSEPSTYPINPLIDYKIYFYLKRKNIPIGLYYRDAYWKYKDYFKKGLLKKGFLKARYYIDFFVYNRTISTIFFQTESFGKIFKTKNKKEILPPAGEIKNSNFYKPRKEKIENCIYVGGISKRYGTDILLKAFSTVNKKHRINLKIVCRREEYKKEFPIIKNFLKEKWISFYHKSANELENLYKESDFGIIPLKIDSYNPMIIPVKLFEYLSFGLPVIVTGCKEMASFVKKNKVGLVCNDDFFSLSKAILDLVQNRQKYEIFKKNTLFALKAGNLWKDRVKKIDEVLSR